MLSSILLSLLPLTANAINIVQSNDDGWAEINLREFYNSLTNAGFNSLISAPADNKSGSGSSDEEPEQVGSSGCQFNSCPPNSPPTGNNASMPQFNYVNSFPVTSIRHGIQTLSPLLFPTPPDLALAGPNVGTNLGIITQFSGTVGAATEAAKLGLPALALSGASGSPTPWNTPSIPPYSKIYADLSTTIVQALTSAGTPYLPEGVFLNVNFPAVGGRCASTGDFRFVLSRVYPAIPFVTGRDVETCGGDRLPTERAVVGTEGCFVSISTADTRKRDADAEAQAFVVGRLRSILSCLPED